MRYRFSIEHAFYVSGLANSITPLLPIGFSDKCNDLIGEVVSASAKTAMPVQVISFLLMLRLDRTPPLLSPSVRRMSPVSPKFTERRSRNYMTVFSEMMLVSAE